MLSESYSDISNASLASLALASMTGQKTKHFKTPGGWKIYERNLSKLKMTQMTSAGDALVGDWYPRTINFSLT